jgi:hypothetical protein
MLKQTLLYSLAVWLTGVLVSPAVIILLNLLHGDRSLLNISIYVLALTIGFLYSIPSFVIACLNVYLVKCKSISGVYRMIILTISGIILTSFAMMLSNQGINLTYEKVYWTCIYSAVIVGGIFLYKRTLAERAVLQHSV